MGRPRIGIELKKPSDYTYDYPEVRAMGELLDPLDKNLIADKTGYSYSYITSVCDGKRKNMTIEEWIRKIAHLNLEKKKRLNS